MEIRGKLTFFGSSGLMSCHSGGIKHGAVFI